VQVALCCRWQQGELLLCSNPSPASSSRQSPERVFYKGIVAYTLVANHIPINATVIGANEHESHYV